MPRPVPTYSAELAVPSALLSTLAVGIVHLSPVYAGADPEEAAVVDFALEHLNPVAQQWLGIPEFRLGTVCTLLPRQTDFFDFCRATFFAEGVGKYDLRYGWAGWHVVAQRQGEQLVAVLTELPPTERPARSATPASYPLGSPMLSQVLLQTTLIACVLHGPTHVLQSFNPAYERLLPGRIVAGRPVAEQLPQPMAQGLRRLLDHVYTTGDTYAGFERPLAIGPPGGPAATTYLNLTIQPYQEGGQTVGLTVLGHDVTQHVLARRQLHQRKLHKQLRATNEELWANNQRLAYTQQQEQELNQKLEARVAAGVAAAQQARAEADCQRQRLERLFRQSPAAISILGGPDLVYEFVNDRYQRLYPGRQMLGLPLRDARPAPDEHVYVGLVHRVYETGITYEGREALHLVPTPHGGAPEVHYFDYLYQPRYDGQNRIDGVLIFALEVTDRVRARQQQQQLNAELETRVAARTQEAQAARAVAEARHQQLHAIVEQAPVAMAYLVGPELRLTSINPAACQLWGCQGAALLGRPLLEALPQLRGLRFEERLLAVLHTQEAYREQGAQIQVLRDGKPVAAYVDFVFQPLADVLAGTKGVLVVAVEVTEQMRAHLQVQHLNQELEARVAAGIAAAQQARAEAEYQRQRLERSFQQAPLAICLLEGPELVYELVNPAYQQRFPGRQLLGRSLLQALPELAAHPSAMQLRRVYETGRTHMGHEVMMRVARPDTGQLEDAYFNCVYQARFNEQGDIDGVLLFALDVTAQRQAQQRAQELQTQVLQAAQRRVQERDAFYQVFAQTPAAVAFMRGPQYEFEYLNQAFEELFPGRALQHRSLAEVLPEAQKFITFLNQVYRTGVPYVGNEVELTTTSAAGLPLTKYLNFTYQAYRERGMVVGISVFAYEVTEQVRARQQLGEMNDALRASNAQLTRTNTDLDNFIYTASHDLKAPIGNIESLLLLLRQQLPAEARQAGLVPKVLHMMQNAIERFQLTIAQLTDLSHLQQAYTERPEAVDVATTIEAVRLDLAPEFEATSAQLLVELTDCPTLLLAPQHLRSVVYNLVSNALKYRHPDRVPQVHLRCATQDGHTFLAVQDNGLGLDAAQQQKVFGLFRRLHAHVEGTGVGLYMVKRIVENAGGTVAVQSEPGVGATFTVSLPN